MRARIPETPNMAGSVPADWRLRLRINWSMRDRTLDFRRRKALTSRIGFGGLLPAFRLPSPFAGRSGSGFSARSGAAPDFGSEGRLSSGPSLPAVFRTSLRSLEELS